MGGSDRQDEAMGPADPDRDSKWYEDPDVKAGIRLLARLARVAEQTCQGAGVSLPQYRLLVSVSGRAQRASELATSVGVSRPTLTSLVDGLEQGGLLKRVPVPGDRRGIRLELTDAGREATARTERALAMRFAELLSDRTAVVDDVRDLVAGMGRALDQERKVA